ncbi:ANTAR domain-containing response regulator [Streptomyces sp. NPDC059788]|uniref:ANTAR domain-containing response regulator n=1 Tax=Streptomyces sp. NPDC059788 TaxID=3346948 RepID=UPI00364EE06F
MRRGSLAALRLSAGSRGSRTKPAEAGGGPDAAAAGHVESAVERLRAENAQLRRALDSRALIDQARGVLMATEACTAEQAWEILRQTSQHSNIKVREVAGEVVAGATGTTGPGPVRTQLRAAVARHHRAAGRRRAG